MNEPIHDDNSPAVGSRLYQVTELDLSELERILPCLCERLFDQLGKNQPGATLLRVQLKKCKDIIGNVRWNYGPPLDVERTEL